MNFECSEFEEAVLKGNVKYVESVLSHKHCHGTKAAKKENTDCGCSLDCNVGYLVNKELSGGNTALHLSTASDLSLLLLPYVNSLSLNKKNNNGETPLYLAAVCNNTSLIEEILRREDLDVNVFIETPLHAALQAGHYDAVKLFSSNHRTKFWSDIKYKPEVTKKEESDKSSTSSIFYNKTSNNNETKISHKPNQNNLIEQIKTNEDGDIMNEGDLPLHIAVSLGLTDIVSVLVNSISDINCVNLNNMSPLWIALSCENSDIVKLLLKDDRIEINYSFDGKSPLMFSLSKSMIDIALILIGKGADLHSKDSEGRNVVHYCAVHSLDDLLEYFIDKGVDASCVDSKGFSPFHCAVSRPNLDIVKIFIKHGADIEARDAGYYSYTPLQFAVKNRNFEVAKYLIDNGADINAYDPHCHYARNRGGTLLHWACRDWDLYTVKFLVENGASINSEENDGRTPLCLAVKHNSSNDILTYLIDSGAELNTKRGGTPLYWAFYMRDYHAAKLLLQHISDVNLPIDNFDEWGRERCALHICADLSVIKLLVSKGANVNALDKENNTPLHLAPSVSVVKYLLDNGAEINARNSNGDNPLHTASNLRIALYLIQHGCDVNALNNQGYTTLHSTNHVISAQQLVASGVDLNTLTSQGKTVIHTLLERYDDMYTIDGPNLLRYFISKRIDVNAKDSNNKTALELIPFYYSSDLIKILIDNGASIPQSSPEEYVHSKYINQTIAAIKNKENIHLTRLVHYLPLNYNIDENKNRLLHLATLNNHQEFIKFMLFQKKVLMNYVSVLERVDVNVMNSNKLTPLFLAAKLNNLKLVKWFLKSGGKYQCGEKNLTLDKLTDCKEIKHLLELTDKAHESVLSRDINNLNEILIEEPDIINSVNEIGDSLLNTACHLNFLDFVKLLLSKNIDLSLINNRKQSCLHLVRSYDVASAIISNFVRTFERTKFDKSSKKVDLFNEFINLKDDGGKSPLHLASERGCYDTVELLIKCGAAYDVKDYEGRTPRDYGSNGKITSLLDLIDTLFKYSEDGDCRVLQCLDNRISHLTRNYLGETLVDCLECFGHSKIAGELKKCQYWSESNLPTQLKVTCLGNTTVTDRQTSDDSDSDFETFGLFD